MISYTEDDAIFVPETEIKEVSSSHTYKALRGYCASLAVFSGSLCIGWIDTRTLGYETAREWLDRRL